MDSACVCRRSLMISSVRCEEGPDSEAAFYSRDKPYFEADEEERQVEAAKRATADPLPLAPGRWRGGTESLMELFPDESSM